MPQLDSQKMNVEILFFSAWFFFIQAEKMCEAAM